MRAGRLIHEVQLRSFTSVKGVVGGTTKVFADFGDPMPANIKDLRGTVKEVVTEGGKTAQVTSEILMRYIPGVKAQMQVVHGSDVYTIQFVENWERRNEKLILSCTAGAVGG